MKGVWPLLAVVLGVFLTPTKAAHPNIVFILADDYGYSDIGYHGAEINTPNLDALAAAGVKLDNYYVQPICTPTRSTFLSGRYQIHTGLQHMVIGGSQPNGLPVTMPTIADALKERGYATHMIGKWHVGFYEKAFLPTHRGFDTYYGCYNAMIDYYDHTFGSSSCGLDLHNNEDPAWDDSGKYVTHLFATRAIDIIANHDNSTPFFLYLAFNAPHWPLQVPSEYTAPYANITDPNRKLYAGMVSCMDEAVGNVTDALKNHGLTDNTIIVFSSDNGGSWAHGGYNWPLRGEKITMWEGGIKAIGFVNSPLLQHPGTSIKELIHISDWYPTLVGLSGAMTIHDAARLDGFDQWTVISEGESTLRTELLHNIDPLIPWVGHMLPGSPFDNRLHAGIRMGNYKLITGDPGNGDWVPPPGAGSAIPSPDDKTKNLWLFDIISDPEERTDLSATMPGTVTMMLDRLAYYYSTAVQVRYPASDPNANPKFHGCVWGPWIHHGNNQNNSQSLNFETHHEDLKPSSHSHNGKHHKTNGHKHGRG